MVVAAVGALLWRACRRDRVQTAPRGAVVDISQLAPDIRRGLDNDFFFLVDADALDLLRRRDEILTPPDPGLAGSARAKQFGEAYTFVVGRITTLGSAEPRHRSAARRIIDEDITRLRIAFARSGAGSGLDGNRLEGNLGFWAALAWLSERPLPDATALAALRRCATSACDYAEPARKLLTHAPEDSYGEALAAWTREDMPMAIELFGRHIERDPTDGAALVWRGLAQLRSAAPARALEDFDRAISIDPDNVAALEGRGHALYRLKRTGPAIEAWTRAAERSPRRAPFLRELVRAAREST